jgi:osmotically-inducible protein OsmY
MNTTLSQIEPIIEDKVRAWATDPESIEISVQDGTVTLNGQAPADEAYQLCAALRRIPGIEAVENRIDLT